MINKLRPQSNDAGTTLIEVIMTVAIMAVAFVAILGGLGTSIITSAIHRQEATAQTVVRDYAEAVQASTAWTACATPATYSPAAVTFSSPNGYTAVATGVAFWVTSTASTTTWSSNCPAQDTGLQMVTLTVSSARATETLAILKRCPNLRGTGANQCP